MAKVQYTSGRLLSKFKRPCDPPRMHDRNGNPISPIEDKVGYAGGKTMFSKAEKPVYLKEGRIDFQKAEGKTMISLTPKEFDMLEGQISIRSFCYDVSTVIREYLNNEDTQRDETVDGAMNNILKEVESLGSMMKDDISKTIVSKMAESIGITYEEAWKRIHASQEEESQ